MFHIIGIKGEQLEALSKINIDDQITKSIIIEYIKPVNQTFLFLFHLKRSQIKRVLLSLDHLQPVLDHITYHAAYQKNIYVQETGSVTSQKTEHLLLQSFVLWSDIKHQKSKQVLFLENSRRKNRLKEQITYTSINELINLLKEEYDLKYVIPFYYLREMKEFQHEKRIKVKELNQLYLLEYKALEGKKR